jgi:Na+/H+-dicarboxylate symporter
MAGMAAGILLGHFAPHVGERLQPLGDAFIKAMRMLIAPIVFATSWSASRRRATWRASDVWRSRP